MTARPPPDGTSSGSRVPGEAFSAAGNGLPVEGVRTYLDVERYPSIREMETTQFGLGAFGAGRILGVDAWLEDTVLVEHNPWLRLLLG